MTRYAEHTEVSSDKSRAEIERTLSRYGADAFGYARDNTKNKAVISFRVGARFYRIVVPLPAQDDPEFTLTPSTRKRRTPQAAQDAWEQATRQRWRALALWIKAVLEASESGITTLEEALQPFILLPDGQTVGDWMQPQIDQAYETGQMPSFLPLLEHTK
ncbi:MAG: hypothetical protein ACYDIC_07225 [Desulfobaccales bacterium]